MSFQTRKIFVRLRNTIQDILDENREACDCPIDCQVNNTVKAQKNMKDIVKNEYPLEANNVCCSVSAAPHGYAVFVQIKA